MIVDCLSCGATYNISDDKVRGRRVRVRCKSCGDGVVVDGTLIAADDATRVYSPEPDATRVYSPDFQPSAYDEDGGRDESTRVMSAPPSLAAFHANREIEATRVMTANVDWREPEPGDWTVNLSDTDQRTMSLEEIVRGYLDGSVGDDAFVWRDGMSDWLPVTRVPEIRHALETNEATRVVSPAAATPARAPGPGRASTTNRAQRTGASALPPPPAPFPPPKAAPLPRSPTASFAPPPAPLPPPAPPPSTPAVAYSAPATPPRARLDSAPEATVQYSPPPRAQVAPPPRHAAAPARVRQGRPHGADLFATAELVDEEEDLLNSSSLPLAQYEEKPIGARNENSVLFSLDTLKAGRAGLPSSPSRALAASAPTAADILGMTASGALPGMDAQAMLLSAPAVAAPVSVVQQQPAEPAFRSRIDTTPPTSRDKGKMVLIAAVVVGAIAVLGGVGFVMHARLSHAEVASSPPSSPQEATNAGTPSAIAVATSKPSPAAHAAAQAPAPSPAAPAAAPATVAPPPEAPRLAAAKPPPVSARIALAVAPKPAAKSTREEKIEALKAALRAGTPKNDDKPEKSDDPPASKVVLAEDTSGGDEPAPAPVEEPPKPPFDTSAAKSALATASSGAASCKKPDGPTGRGKVQVTFSPSGRATNATVIEGPFGGTSTGGCVAKIFRRSHVPAFSGDPVTVSKSFTIPE